MLFASLFVKIDEWLEALINFDITVSRINFCMFVILANKV